MGDRRALNLAFMIKESLGSLVRSHDREEVIEMLYLPSEQGQGIVEYALLLALVTIVVIVVLALLGPAIGNVFSNLYQNI